MHKMAITKFHSVVRHKNVKTCIIFTLKYLHSFKLFVYVFKYFLTLLNTIKAMLFMCACMTTRAMHLELVPNLTTPFFELAFKRFCSGSGTPAVCVSDNGSNFKGATNKKTARYKFLRYVNV